MIQAPDIAKMKQLAAQGSRIAQYNLGVWILKSSSGGPIIQEAHLWLLESARQGFAPAQAALGSIYSKRRGPDYDPDRAAHWFEKAAGQGLADAQYCLAELRGMNEGVDVEYQLTRQGFEQAAAQNHSPALCQLAYCQDHGIGRASDPPEATRTWMRAADLGAPRAASNLGWRYRTGFTIQQDPTRSLAWYLRAEAADYPGAPEAIATLSDSLSEEAIASARELATRTIGHDDPVPTDGGVLSFEVEQLTTTPRISHLKEFFTIDECDHLVHISRPFMQPSKVIAMSGSTEQNQKRTSEESPIWPQIRDLVVHRLEARMHEVSGTPILHGEPIMVLHYGEGMEYRTHKDYFETGKGRNREQLSRGGQRLVTIIAYLSSVDAGGATEFPKVGISIAPTKGDAVMFFNTHDDGTPDPLTEHAGRPVMSGHKWLATRWIREWNWREPRSYMPPADR